MKGGFFQVNDTVRDRAGQRVGAGRARRPRNLALLLEDQRRHAHRQPGRGMWRNYLFFDTPTTTSSLSTRKRAKSAGTWRSPISTSSISRRPLPSSPAITSSSARGTIRRPGISSVVRSGDGETAVEVLHRADEPGDPGLETWPNLDAARTAAATPGCQARSIRKRSSISSAPATPRRVHRRRKARRQPVHVPPDCRECRYWKNGVVLPDVAARHT